MIDDPPISYEMFCVDCIIKGIKMRYIIPIFKYNQQDATLHNYLFM